MVRQWYLGMEGGRQYWMDWVPGSGTPRQWDSETSYPGMGGSMPRAQPCGHSRESWDGSWGSEHPHTQVLLLEF